MVLNIFTQGSFLYEVKPFCRSHMILLVLILIWVDFLGVLFEMGGGGGELPTPLSKTL